MTEEPTERSEPTEPQAEIRTVRFDEAVTEGLRQMMQADEQVFCAGHGIRAGGGGGAFGGLHDEFGDRRVVDTPISEQAIAGLGVGAAVAGLRPVVDLTLMDFALLAMDQIVNQAAKFRYLFGGEARVPLTITCVTGAGSSAGAHHSQSLEAMLCHVPGLKVVMPSSPAEAKGLLVAAIRDNNPVVFLMPRALLTSSGPCRDDLFEAPIGRARVVRPGTACTVVAYGSAVAQAQRVGERLSGEGLEVEVVDVRSLQPLDIDTIVGSVERTNRCVVAHEAVRFGGLGAEIAAQVQQRAFDYLDAPVARLGAPFTPVPFSPPLEAAFVPSDDRLVDTIRAVLDDESAALG